MCIMYMYVSVFGQYDYDAILFFKLFCVFRNFYNEHILFTNRIYQIAINKYIE